MNAHSSESCLALYLELRPSLLKERAARRARQARVVPVTIGSSLNVKLKLALLSETKAPQSDASRTTDSYYANAVFDRSM
jgi:hypothetical protein